MGVAFDAWMYPLKDDLDLHKEIDQPLLFINMEAFQDDKSLKVMRRFTQASETERRVVTLK